MTKKPSKPLEDHAQTLCPYCGATVWLYQLPIGGHIALDDVPGEHVIDGRNIVYRTTGPVGYRDHSQSCGRIARAPLTGEVRTDEFMWL